MSEEEKNKRIKEQFDRHVLDSRVATVGKIRDLLLSDEFIDALAKRMNEKLFDATFKPIVCGIDKAKQDSFSVISEWAGKENEVSE